MENYRQTHRKGHEKPSRIMSVHSHVTEPTPPRHPGRLAQLVICSLLFAALVGAKLLLPEGLQEVEQTLEEALHRNMDVEEVFAAVGEVFGPDSTGKGLIQAVFGEQEPTAVPVQKPVTMTLPPEGALETFRRFQKEAERQEQTATPASIPYHAENLPDNVSMEQGLLGFAYTVPAQGPVSSGFGWREHPTGGGTRFHYGVDLAAEADSPVVSFADGTVTLVGESTGYGKYCMVSHPGGWQTLYAHCSRISIASGDQVSKGQTLGQVGDTGLTTGAHLHFELQKDGTYYNPIYYVQ